MDYLNRTIVEPVYDDQILSVDEILEHLESLGNWELIADENRGQYIKRVFNFGDVDSARKFISEMKKTISEIYTVPEILLKGTEVSVRCCNSELKAVHINDIIVAAHADDLYEQLNTGSSEQNKVDMASDASFPASDAPGY